MPPFGADSGLGNEPNVRHRLRPAEEILLRSTRFGADSGVRMDIREEGLRLRELRLRWSRAAGCGRLRGWKLRAANLAYKDATGREICRPSYPTRQGCLRTSALRDRRRATRPQDRVR